MHFVSRSWLTVFGVGMVGLLSLAGCQKKASSSAKADARALASAAPSANAVASAAPAPPLKHKIFLMMEYRNEEPEYVHAAWFMDTEGNEYRYSSKEKAA